MREHSYRYIPYYMICHNGFGAWVSERRSVLAGRGMWRSPGCMSNRVRPANGLPACARGCSPERAVEPRCLLSELAGQDEGQ